ncbi:MAG TPA: polysaccharide biosynthesis tyrosine autokinase [Bryobacteraceae bacterium]|nr:polysaccharide biosynthesis tyrosine autokinase [Bryobacteraceae bacterium]HTF70432.1 polysaccharide biosynthesis tyrosine autokinase [Edaphobacter sp.]
MEKQSLIQTLHLTDLAAVAPAAVSRLGYSAEPQTGSLLDYWHAISRRKFALAVLSLASLGVGIGVTLLQTPMYRATTSMEIQDAKQDNLAAKILNPQPDLAPVDSLTDIQTQIKILQSQSLIERALDKAHMSSLTDPGVRSTETAPWSKLFPAAPEGSRERLAEKVAKNLKVSAVSQTRIVEISYQATDPVLAARFANAITSEFIEQNLQARWQMNRKTSEWLVSQMDEMRDKLRHSEATLQAYAREKGLIYTGDKQNISEAKLRELQSELSRAQADRVEKQSRSEVARSATPESVPEVLNDSSLKTMENNILGLQQQEAQMGVTFKPDYTKAKRLRAEIESLQSAIESKRTMIISRLENELDESRRREQLLGAAYAQQTRVVTDDSQKSIQYDMLKHEVDTNLQIYQVMLQRVKESGIASALSATNVRVVDPARAPLLPYKPNLPMNVAGSLLCGLMLGVAVIIVRSKADGSVQEPGDAGMLLGIPELGVIPAAGPGLTRASRVQALFSPKKELENQSLQVISSYGSPQVADSFRAVLASILFAGARQRQRVLVVTSASPGEGKTTMTSNLATTLANMGRRVLLIDGDIRSPRLHSIFGLENSTGLTTTLTQIALKDVLTETFIRETTVPNLHVLTSGPAIQAGADLLFSASMPTLIAKYRDAYDMVLIDTPPMLVMPDARVLARAADAVVLVARASQTTRSAIQAAYQRFVEDRTPVLGVVLNNWNAKLSAHNYYAAYAAYKEPAAERVVVKATPAGA